MDLDKNGETNMLEVQAYFATNGYLICRPLREETLERHNATIQEMLRQIDQSMEIIFNILDPRKNWELDLHDLSLLYNYNYSHFTHNDQNITEKEWNYTTREIFGLICENKHKINEINKVPN